MMTRLSRLSALLAGPRGAVLWLTLTLVPAVALAQPDTERLPDLTPRAFEIRGDLQISLPNLERQPLRGFAPPPRTYVVPGSRQTYVAAYGQDLDGLPADPLAAPDPPDASALSPLAGRIDAAFGRYASRLGRLTLSAGGLGVNASYAGYSGFAITQNTNGPFDIPFDAVSDVFDGRIAYTTPGPTRYGFALDGDYQRYSLTGQRFLPLREPPNRTGRTVGGSVSVASDVPERPRFHATARFASTDFAVSDPDNLFDVGMDEGAYDQTEARFEAEGDLQISLVRFDAAGALSGLGDEGVGESLTSYSAGGTVRLNVGRGVLDVGARVLGYDSSVLNRGGSSQNVGPVALFEAPLSTTTRLFLRTDPSATQRGLGDLFRENPYAVPEPFLAPDIHVVDGKAGLEIQSRSVRFTLYGGARFSPVALHFVRDITGAAAGLYDVRYAEQRVYSGGGSVTFYAPNGLHATLAAEFRAGTLPDTQQDIPYFAPVVGELSLAMPFADSRGLVQVTGSAESARPREAPLDSAPAWATLDAEAHYQFASGIAGLLRAERLAGRAEQWPGYPRPPAALLAGLRVQW